MSLSVKIFLGDRRGESAARGSDHGVDPLVVGAADRIRLLDVLGLGQGLAASVFGLELLPHAAANMTIRPAATTTRENLPMQLHSRYDRNRRGTRLNRRQ